MTYSSLTDKYMLLKKRYKSLSPEERETDAGNKLFDEMFDAIEEINEINRDVIVNCVPLGLPLKQLT